MTLKLLPETERLMVSKQDVVVLERKILQILEFNLNFDSPLTFLERFLRLLEVHDDEVIVVAAKDICLKAKTESSLLGYLPSELGAACVIWAVNLVREKNEVSLKYWNLEVEKYSGISQGKIANAFNDLTEVVYQYRMLIEE